MFVLRSQITQCLPLFSLWLLLTLEWRQTWQPDACLQSARLSWLHPPWNIESGASQQRWGLSRREEGCLGGREGGLQASSPVSVCVWQWPLGGPGSQTCSRGRSRADLVFAQRQTTEICVLTQSKKEEREKKEGRRLRVCRSCGSPRAVGSPQAQLECQCVSPPGLA